MSPAPALIADAMLGRLAKWLRILGYDVVYDSEIADDLLLLRARAEHRLILTRDRGLRYHPAAPQPPVFVQSDHLPEQLQQVVRKIGPAVGAPFSRCPICNTVLAPLARELAGGRVPPFVFETQTQFSSCARCGRIYWPGSHWQRMRERLEGLLSGSFGGEPR